MVDQRDTVAAQTGWKRAVRRVAPFMLLGPISGPIVAGVVLNLRDGRPVLASMYAVLFGLLTFLSAPLAAILMAKLV